MYRGWGDGIGLKALNPGPFSGPGLSALSLEFRAQGSFGLDTLSKNELAIGFMRL